MDEGEGFSPPEFSAFLDDTPSGLVNPTPPYSGSDKSDVDIPQNLTCTICERRQVQIFFKVCSHATCKSCAKGTWRSVSQLIQTEPPTYFPCPFCSAVVNQVGIFIITRAATLGDQVGYGGISLTVRDWPSVRRWMVTESDEIRLALIAMYSARIPTWSELNAQNMAWIVSLLSDQYRHPRYKRTRARSIWPNDPLPCVHPHNPKTHFVTSIP